MTALAAAGAVDGRGKALRSHSSCCGAFCWSCCCCRGRSAAWATEPSKGRIAAEREACLARTFEIGQGTSSKREREGLAAAERCACVRVSVRTTSRETSRAHIHHLPAATPAYSLCLAMAISCPSVSGRCITIVPSTDSKRNGG